MRYLCLLIACFLYVANAPADDGNANVDPVDFSRDIRPLMSNRCFHCHGHDENRRKADMRLDTEEGAKEFAVSPGDPDDSELIARISHTDLEERMPPRDSGKEPLSPEEIALFTRWIEEGAVWEEHWAFITPTMPAPPQSVYEGWRRNDIDAFVAARLDAEGLGPSPSATRETLIRRATLDLTGLPPTIEEIDAFLEDDTEGAYERVVDRLLASPHYGERMTMDWLDAARYADTNGYQNDFSRSMWPWRDWVIAAFNDNMPFDRFAIEQIAGDLLPEATVSQQLATGFVRNNRSVTEGGSIEEEWRIENIVDRVETVSTVFLGLTMGCARCHDHKYDPIAQEEFYEFFAFFNNTEDKGFYSEKRGNSGPTVMLPILRDDPDVLRRDRAIDEAKMALKDLRAARRVLPEDWSSETPPDNLPEPSLSLPLQGDLQLTLRGKEETKSLEVGPHGRSKGLLWGEGLFTKALFFNARSAAYLDLGAEAAINLDSPFSISMWVRPDGPGTLVSQTDAEDDRRNFLLSLTEGRKLSVQLNHQAPDDAIALLTEHALKRGVWAHLCLTYNGSRNDTGLRLYIDGTSASLEVETSKLSKKVLAAGPLMIGRSAQGEYFSGAISDLRTFTRALNPAEVDAVHDSALGNSLPGQPSEDELKAFQAYRKQQRKFELRRQKQDIRELEDAREKFIEDERSVMVMAEREERRPTYRLVRGMYDAPDETKLLEPGIPAFLPQLPIDAPQNRLGLALWIVDRENPLTARVTVNRMWRKFFGQGLVKSIENFGMQSAPPTHPELLDWLAVWFVEKGWDLKALQKLIVTSATYRQDSAISSELQERDPENLLYARGSRMRVSAEVVRDNALAISGLLVSKIGGPPVKPYQPEGLWLELAGGASQGAYMRGNGDEIYRRSLYTYRKRTVPHPTLSTFDAPSWEICRVMRSRTNTPLQALALLNDTTYVEAARGLAERMLLESGPEVDEQLQYGFRLATGRVPTVRELGILKDGYAGYLDLYRGDPGAADDLLAHGESSANADLDRATLAACTAVATVILNLDETITKE